MHIPKPYFAICLLLVLSGCERSTPTLDRRPRPVSVSTLAKQPPPNGAMVAASAAAWKKERLAFEVGGRIEFVAEQNTEIEGRIRDAEGKLIIQGTPIARIQPDRYQLEVSKAVAAVARANQNLAIAQTELDETIPARIDAAQASLKAATFDLDRQRRLQARNAGSQAQVDAAENVYQSAVAQLKQLVASEKSQQATIKSLESAVLQAKQSQTDAERNLEDCTLYSPFRGRVSEVSVVPGTLIQAGDPVVTLQIMDPIKIELEVSAEQSRKLKPSQVLPIHISMPDGTTQTTEGYLYQIDPSADPQTRTFTVTIISLNKTLGSERTQDCPTARDLFRMDLKFIPGAKDGDLFIEQTAIHRDKEGAYLWMVTNSTIQKRSASGGVMKVRKLRVTPGDLIVPYLGELIFQNVTVDDDEYEPATHFIVGPLTLSDSMTEPWEGDSVMLQSEAQWLLRPGDLVKVDLSSQDTSPGFYVPMDAIVRRDGKSFLFAVEASDVKSVARKIEIAVGSMSIKQSTSTLQRIESIDGTSLSGLKYVTRGCHFLIDGEEISAVEPEATR